MTDIVILDHKISYSIFFENFHFLWFFHFIALILIVFMGLMSMFIAILSEEFAKVKEDMKTQKNETEVLSYIADTIKSVKKGKKSKDRRVGDSSEPITKDVTSSLNVASLSVTVKEPIDYSQIQLFDISKN